MSSRKTPKPFCNLFLNDFKRYLVTHSGLENVNTQIQLFTFTDSEDDMLFFSD